MSFPGYPKYKDSGVEWLEKIPEHWAMLPIKHLGKLKGGSGFPHEDQGVVGEQYPFFKVNALGAADPSGVLVPSEDSVSRETAHRLGAFVFPPGTLVLAKVGAALLLGRIRLLPREACIDNNMIGIMPAHDVCIAFLRHAMSLVRFDVLANPGAVPSIGAGELGAFRLPTPPPEEQVEIAAFLDHETAKIDALVAEQRHLMELLKEKRQAVISYAVTKGLNLHVPMKDSGIEWMGEVPARWRVMPLGRVTLSRCDGPFGSGLKSEHYTESGVRVIRLQNIRAGAFDGSDEAFLDSDYYHRDLLGHDVIGGDLLIAGLGDDNNTVGRACVAPPGIGPSMVKADCFRFRLDMGAVVPEYVAMALCAGAATDAGRLSSGSTRSRISLSIMTTRRVPIPPIGEQMAISGFVRAKTSEFDGLIAQVESAVHLLQERRVALISAAVTGQIDVRNIKERRSAA